MSYTANKVAEMVEHANQLQAALTAAAERETKLREENQRLQREIERLEDTNRYQNAEVEDAEAEVERLKGELERWKKLGESIQLESLELDAAGIALGLKREQDTQGFDCSHTGPSILRALAAERQNDLGLTPDSPREK